MEHLGKLIHQQQFLDLFLSLNHIFQVMFGGPFWVVDAQNAHGKDMLHRSIISFQMKLLKKPGALIKFCT